jgi:hypothetical protein
MSTPEFHLGSGEPPPTKFVARIIAFEHDGLDLRCRYCGNNDFPKWSINQDHELICPSIHHTVGEVTVNLEIYR